jgi:glycosyltransferase involved in cell wall biosynthesis
MSEVTVGIPIFNGAATIKGVLDRLTLMRIPNLPVLVYDNGSFDGTNGLMGELAGRGYYKGKQSQDKTTLDLKYFIGTHKNDEHPYQNALRTRHLIASIASTPYIFFLDSDVILPPNAILTLLEDFKKEDNCAFMGIRYEPDTHSDHVMFGATMWKREDFLKSPQQFDVSKGCDCKHACDWSKQIDKQSKYHPWLMGYHCKYF